MSSQAHIAGTTDEVNKVQQSLDLPPLDPQRQAVMQTLARIAVEIYPSDALHKLRVGGMAVVAAGKSAKVESKKKVKAPSNSEKQASGPTFLRTLTDPSWAAQPRISLPQHPKPSCMTQLGH